jgi:hypothetical protein
LLKVFVVLAMVILPVLIPINYIGGKGGKEVQGLDRLAWSNVTTKNTDRYWAHLVLAVTLIVTFCYVSYNELRKYVRMRQAYLTSPQHRLKASATTVLVSAIPSRWLTVQKLVELYDAFPGGIRNVWINRDYDALQAKVKERDELAKKLEKAETVLIKICWKKHKQRLEKEAKKNPRAKGEKRKAVEVQEDLAAKPGISSGDPHQIPHQLRESTPTKKMGLDFINPIPIVGGAVTTVGHGVMGGVRRIAGGLDMHRAKGAAVAVEDDAGRQPERPMPQQTHTSHSSHSGKKRGSTLMGPDGEPIVSEERPTVTLATPSTPVAMGTTLATGGLPEEIAKNPKLKKRHLRGRKLTDRQKRGDEDETPLSLPSPTRTVNTLPESTVDGVFKPRKDYPKAYDKKYKGDNWGEPVWKKYISEKRRPTMRLPLVKWLPALPLIGKKVDTIHHCRKELARLNLEIEMDQETPERYPIMNSAFVQFNQQVAAHMACQAVSHHVPQHMAPRHIEVSPNDVVWGNMKMQWWERYVRKGLIMVATGALVIGWAFPVAAIGLISQISYLTDTFSWLRWLGNLPDWVRGLISGVLPPLLLGILMAVLPMILRLFARIQGCHTGMAIERAVQGMYFAFLFIQVFLVVSISSGVTTVVEEISKQPFQAPEILARNLPKASNFFFSYLLLQAFSVSGAALLQLFTLLMKFIVSPILDSTAREKFTRTTNLQEIQWGTFFPVYTNLACIGIVYSVISPLILVFIIITFSLFWMVYRYNLLFVVNFRFDTGGLLFPRAINQLFTGIYVMEICLIGLFFLVRDSQDRVACVPQGIVMIIATAFTVIFQLLLNRDFGPLLTYLPITLEDDAAIRDQEFEKEQNEQRRKHILPEEQPGDDLNKLLQQREQRGLTSQEESEIELQPIENGSEKNSNSPRTDPEGLSSHAHRKPELALFRDIADEIEDLTPEDRDLLVTRAFQHPAIRAKRPVIWIPQDVLGVSEDEIVRTRKFSEKVWISNDYAGLDSKGRVVYGRSPPDFDMRDLVEL